MECLGVEPSWSEGKKVIKVVGPEGILYLQQVQVEEGISFNSQGQLMQISTCWKALFVYFLAEQESIRDTKQDYWGLVLKCYELRTRQHKKRLMINALRPSKHYFP
jgi:hypothetical protein